MEFRLIINMDNAAFEENPQELGRILRDVANMVSGANLPPMPDEDRYNLRDYNGNRVGYFETVED